MRSAAADDVADPDVADDEPAAGALLDRGPASDDTGGPGDVADAVTEAWNEHPPIATPHATATSVTAAVRLLRIPVTLAP